MSKVQREIYRLDCFLVAYRNTPNLMSGKIPAEFFLGPHPRTRLTLVKLSSSRVDGNKTDDI